MARKTLFVLAIALLLGATNLFAVVRIVRSPAKLSFASCRGSFAASRVPFSAEDMRGDAFVKFLSRMGVSVVVKDHDIDFKKIRFTFVSRDVPTLCELVEAFARSADLHADVEGKRVVFSSHMILSYTLPFPVGRISRSVSFSGGGVGGSIASTGGVTGTVISGGTSGTIVSSSSAGGFAGGGGAQSSSSYELTFWDDLEKGLALITGEAASSNSTEGSGLYWADRATGTLFVRVRPSLAKDVDQFVQKLIDKYSKVIRVRVILYELVEDRGSYYKTSWQQAVRNFINANWKLWGEGSATNFPPNQSLWNLQYESFSRDEAGQALSYGILSILKKYGHARIVDQAVVYLSNGYTAEIARGEHQEYVSSLTQTVSEGTVSTSVEKGVIMSGVRFSFRGHVLNDVSWEGPPSVFLSIFSNIVRLESLETFNTGSGQVQNPAYSGKSSFLTFVVPSGRPIVLVALDSRETNRYRSGPPFLGFILGTRSRINARRTLIMVLFPEILDVTRAWGAL